MTGDRPPISTDAELQSEIGTLLLAAHAGGVDVAGGWDCRNEDGHPDWDVVVTKVESGPSSN